MFYHVTQLLPLAAGAVGDVVSGAEEAAVSATPNVQNMAAETVGSSRDAVMDTFSEAFMPLITLAPKVLAAVVIVALGFVLAKLAAKLITALGDTIGLQTAAERSGLAGSMKDVGIERTVPSIVGLIVFWLFMCVSFMAGFKVLGLAAVSDAIQQVVNYIPNLLIATVVIVVGLLVANLLRGIIATSADRVGLSYANQLAAASYYVLASISIYIAAKTLVPELELVGQLLLIAFAGLALGCGLALGLGGRDVVGGILAGYYIRQRFQAGDHVRLGEMEGTVREVGPVATIIESEHDGLMHRHSIPNAMMLKDGVR
ncbi:MAG: mechanosensitive ion channel [Planctomycetales bacterium]|nr:mechanosensitive ion channel [Planctomycetales bacterium]